MYPEQLAEVRNRYRIGDILHVSRLTGGYWNTVLKLETGTASYVLRISHPTTSLNRLQYEHRLMAVVHPHIQEVPAPVPAENGDTFISCNNKWITLFPFMEGAPQSRLRIG
ncbi:phosphotransferase family enzyme [Thermosporothrix hazakensis]|jgi:Ser/Thr protein kinase RdoA (MazF antagonist)|uniref:Phosphotransferase family enzyme n=1 Tax=Thermosporothrix hazakensis TaxID=644383 RepID=A0A326U2Y1_THEHA|nr:phosphotransferase [Thermosporothrix hazakensis]PZW25326.1 phosphotransferase family enzyme [Thermosporothrix hazakensis]GCE50558.1 hypothetical protein KTH_54270 [Thermosporothrix hazakensis]